MNLRIHNLQLEETKKEDSPRFGKEAEFKLFKAKKEDPKPSTKRLSSSPLNPLFTEPRDTEVKPSKCHCVIS